MNARDKGGPAFPIAADGAYIADCENPNSIPVREFPGHPGMTLRDWFAGQALDLIPFDPDDHAAQSVGALPNIPMTEDQHAKLMARRAYMVADAMIAERDKP